MRTLSLYLSLAIACALAACVSDATPRTTETAAAPAEAPSTDAAPANPDAAPADADVAPADARPPEPPRSEAPAPESQSSEPPRSDAPAPESQPAERLPAEAPSAELPSSDRPVGGASGSDANSHLVVAEIALQRGDYHAAAQEYATAARLSSDPALASQATRVAFESGQPSAAVASARRWIELEPTSADAHRYLAVGALRLHLIEESAEQFDYLLRTTYETPADGFTDLTGVLIDEDDAYGALLVMRKLASRRQKVPEAHYALSVAALRAYNYRLAVSSARRAVRLKKNFVEAERLLARSLVVSGKNEEGLEIARARARAQGEAGAQLEVVMLLIASGDDTTARAELEKLVALPDTKVEALRLLGTLELASGRYEEATTHFQELVTTGRYVSLAMYSLGAIHERRREELRAVRYYKLVTSGPYAVDAQLRAAKLLALSDQREQANRLLDDYVVENPAAEADLVVGRARLLSDEGDAETALALLDAGRDRYPDSTTLRYARAITLERLERADEAIAELQDLLERRPGDPVALNALGYTLAEHGREVKAAHAMIRKSLAMTPDNPAVQDSLGWALFRAGDARGALKWLERAYTTEKDAEIAAHIGEVYWELGDKAKARTIWDKALADDPTHRYLLETLRRHPD